MAMATKVNISSKDTDIKVARRLRLMPISTNSISNSSSMGMDTAAGTNSRKQTYSNPTPFLRPAFDRSYSGEMHSLCVQARRSR